MPSKPSRSVTVICARCKKPFVSSIALRARGEGKFCSNFCRYNEPPIDRFYRYVTKTDSCWVWHGGRTKRGYGCFYLNGTLRLAHRVSWFFETGQFPPAQIEVCHSCDNPSCVRPDHLFLGTRQNNAEDCWIKGRMDVGERRYNAKLTPSVVFWIRANLSVENRAMAKRLNVSESLISRIKLNKCWKHLL